MLDFLTEDSQSETVQLPQELGFKGTNLRKRIMSERIITFSDDEDDESSSFSYKKCSFRGDKIVKRGPNKQLNQSELFGSKF